MGGQLPCAAFVVYEQIGPGDAFGRQMVLNLEVRRPAFQVHAPRSHPAARLWQDVPMSFMPCFLLSETRISCAAFHDVNHGCHQKRRGVQSRGCPLRGLAGTPDLDAHQRRFTANCWQRAEARDMDTIHRCHLDPVDRQRRACAALVGNCEERVCRCYPFQHCLCCLPAPRAMHRVGSRYANTIDMHLISACRLHATAFWKHNVRLHSAAPSAFGMSLVCSKDPPFASMHHLLRGNTKTLITQLKKAHPDGCRALPAQGGAAGDLRRVRGVAPNPGAAPPVSLQRPYPTLR